VDCSVLQCLAECCCALHSVLKCVVLQCADVCCVDVSCVAVLTFCVEFVCECVTVYCNVR